MDSSIDPIALAEANHIKVDKHLDEVTVLQMLFKTHLMKAVVLAVLHKAVECGVFWPDEIAFDFLSEDDKNCVGTVFRLLGPRAVKDGLPCGAGLEMIRKTGNFRRSTKEGRRGSTIFQYVLEGQGVPLAKTLVRKYPLAKAKNDAVPRLPGFEEFP